MSDGDRSSEPYEESERAAASLVAYAEALPEGLTPAERALHARAQERLTMQIRAVDGGTPPPRGLEKFLTRDELVVLTEAVCHADRLNEEFAGRPVVEGLLSLCGDAVVVEQVELLRIWADGYVTRRITRLKNRHHEPFALLDALVNELVPWLNRLCPEDQLHSAILGELPWLIPWLGAQKILGWGIPEVADFRESTARHAVRERLTIADERAWLHFLANTLDHVQAPAFDPGPRWIRAYGEALAEMKPVLLGRFGAERSIVELDCGLWVTWRWEMADTLAGVHVSLSERGALLAARQRPSPDQIGAYRVDFSGRLCPVVNRWVNTDLAHPEWALAFLPDVEPAELRMHLRSLNLEIIKAVYDRQAAAWLRLTTGLADRAAAGEEVSGEELVAAVVAERGETDTTTGCSALRGIRYKRLLRFMGDHWGVSARPGKGSEVILHRDGFKLYTLGHHKKNPVVGPRHIYRMLRRFGIDPAEWAQRATEKRSE